MSAPYDPYSRPPQQPHTSQSGGTNGMALTSLVLGVLWLCWLGSIGAIITGIVALSQTRRTGQPGRGLAVAGIVLGAIGVLTGIAVGVIVGLAGYEVQKKKSVSVVLEGTATGGAKEASIAHSTGSIDKMEAAVVAVPWQKRFTKELSGLDVVVMNVTNIGSTGSVTCRITVDGKVVSTDTATGSGSASCTYDRLAG
ncbi:DUF4190 domain-containing protein [Actinomadura rudentiformis]|uniref:DUF4190 domain-containing protein n=1 Tax=Actinomadura rudentiformis TaxID=359158 RepID=A0A6H9YBF3_9ACTN|nr:DUF4190 domain-containing protein [Actinomadura rudentiformis]KAB2341283.1 DUF4190 domain-containing protein [Actinomadura rudentiformis]